MQQVKVPTYSVSVGHHYGEEWRFAHFEDRCILSTCIFSDKKEQFRIEELSHFQMWHNSGSWMSNLAILSSIEVQSQCRCLLFALLYSCIIAQHSKSSRNFYLCDTKRLCKTEEIIKKTHNQSDPKPFNTAFCLISKTRHHLIFFPAMRQIGDQVIVKISIFCVYWTILSDKNKFNKYYYSIAKAMDNNYFTIIFCDVKSVKWSDLLLKIMFQ